MKTRPSLIQSLLIASFAGLLAMPAQARPEGCGGPQGFGPGNERMQNMQGERMKQHQQRLHDALKLTPEQEKAWQTFQASHPMAKRNEQRPDRAAMAKLSAPERAEKMLEWQKQHQEAMSQHVAALKAFYEQLTPEQRKVFDAQPQRAPRNSGRPAGDRPKQS